MDLGLKGKKAFISGATRGIGKACVEEFAKEGAAVALFARDEKLCSEVLADLEKRYPDNTFVMVIADLGLNEGVKKAVDDAAKALGGLDIVVNAAGGSKRGGLGAVSHDEWMRRLDAKPLGLMAVCEAALPYLEKSDHARIINLSGLHGKEPVPWAAMAGAINAATHGFSKSLAGSLGPKGITVNVVTPGFTSGRRFDELIEITAKERGLSEKDAEAWLRELVPLGEPVDAEDVAGAVVYLASKRGKMITGTEIKVDGGRSKHI
ncbi:MAG: SDR family NAD(P)-dependent oxidoreductase [Rhodospirillales bacterium]